MAEREELLESALNALAEGAALADSHGTVVSWNDAAAAITGYRAIEVIGRSVPHVLELIVVGGSNHWVRATEPETHTEHGCIVPIQHALGHKLQVFARVRTLRDALGTRIGAVVLFHASDNIDSLPHGEAHEHAKISESQMQLQDRLARLHDDFDRGDLPLGVLWISVDQSSDLRRSHGSRACEAMLEAIEKTLASGLKPTEEVGRWGEDDFLVLSHERSTAALANHAQHLAGLARTTDFRWWGDRISLTVSIGAAQAEQNEPLSALLERAQSAMLASAHAGGNHITAQGNG